MEIKILEDKEEYKRLHALVFHRPCSDVPSVVLIAIRGDGVVVGFLSGFWLGDNHFYIQFAGILPEYQKRGYLRYFSALLDDEVVYDLAIKNTNVIAMKTALIVGFIPGGSILKDEGYFIQFNRGVKNG